MEVVNMREGHAITTATFLPFVVLVVVIVVVVVVIVAPYASNTARHHQGVCCDSKQVDKGVVVASADTQQWLGGKWFWHLLEVGARWEV